MKTRNLVFFLLSIILISCNRQKHEMNSKQKFSENSATYLISKKDTTLASLITLNNIENLNILKGFRSLKLETSVDSLDLNDWVVMKQENNIEIFINTILLDIDGKNNVPVNSKLTFVNKTLFHIELNFNSLDKDYSSNKMKCFDDLLSVYSDESTILMKSYTTLLDDRKIGDNISYDFIDYRNRIVDSTRKSVVNEDKYIKELVEKANKKAQKNFNYSPTIIPKEKILSQTSTWESNYYGLTYVENHIYKREPLGESEKVLGDNLACSFRHYSIESKIQIYSKKLLELYKKEVLNSAEKILLENSKESINNQKEKVKQAYKSI